MALIPGRTYGDPVFCALPLVTVFLFYIRLRMFLEHGSLGSWVGPSVKLGQCPNFR